MLDKGFYGLVRDVLPEGKCMYEALVVACIKLCNEFFNHEW